MALVAASTRLIPSECSLANKWQAHVCKSHAKQPRVGATPLPGGAQLYGEPSGSFYFSSLPTRNSSSERPPKPATFPTMRQTRNGWEKEEVARGERRDGGLRRDGPSTGD